jgi:hypothetical protein
MVYFGCPVHQFRATVTDDVGAEFGEMIRKRFPSGARSQLSGPVRMPVSTRSVWNRGR